MLARGQFLIKIYAKIRPQFLIFYVKQEVINTIITWVMIQWNVKNGRGSRFYRKQYQPLVFITATLKKSYVKIDRNPFIFSFFHFQLLFTSKLFKTNTRKLHGRGLLVGWSNVVLPLSRSRDLFSAINRCSSAFNLFWNEVLLNVDIFLVTWSQSHKAKRKLESMFSN